MMGWGDDGGWSGNGAGYVVMMFVMAAFWVLVVAAAIWVVRRPGDGDGDRAARRTAPARRSSQQVLAERFARGEIDETELTSRLAALRGQPQP